MRTQYGCIHNDSHRQKSDKAGFVLMRAVQVPLIAEKALSEGIKPHPPPANAHPSQPPTQSTARPAPPVLPPIPVNIMVGVAPVEGVRFDLQFSLLGFV
jgi:hypothetical protein